MVGIPRKGTGWPDRRPPPAVPIAVWPSCARCGQPVAPDERDDGHPARHLICDVTQRAALKQRMDATRAVHRTIAMLAAIPSLRPQLAESIAALPDACHVGDAMAFLSHAKVVVECSSALTTQQRRMAVSFLDATARKLSE